MVGGKPFGKIVLEQGIGPWNVFGDGRMTRDFFLAVQISNLNSLTGSAVVELENSV